MHRRRRGEIFADIDANGNSQAPEVVRNTSL
jgi:hypothetical protein